MMIYATFYIPWELTCKTSTMMAFCIHMHKDRFKLNYSIGCNGADPIAITDCQQCVLVGTLA